MSFNRINAEQSALESRTLYVLMKHLAIEKQDVWEYIKITN